MQEKKVQQMVETARNILDRKKGQDIIALNVSGLTVITEALVIASGRSSVQVKSLANDVDEAMAKAGYQLRRREGHQEGRWIILDYNEVIVHIFHYEQREFYHLERLWDDGTNQLLSETEKEE